MKTPFPSFFLSALLSTPAALSLAADGNSLSGKWNIESSVSGHDSTQACTFVQKDSALSGQCVNELGTVEISGTVKGGKVSWSYKSTYDGQALTVQFAGEIDSSNNIKGTVNVPEFGASGDFNAKPSK